MFRLLTLAALLTLTAHAEQPTQGVDLALISSVKTISPSAKITVGLTIHHHPGFHTYWKNPGAVGLPISIKWDLPPGFTAGEIRWPFPENTSMAGHPVFGYERDITLLIDLTAPTKLPKKPLEFHAQIIWMACSDACFPGNKRLTLTLPAAETTKPNITTQPRFISAEKEIPKLLENWKAEIQTPNNEKTIRITLTKPPTSKDPGQLTFFSSDGQISSDPPPTISILKNGTYQIEAKRAQYSPKDAPTLPFVIITENPIGPHQENFGKLAPYYSPN